MLLLSRRGTFYRTHVFVTPSKSLLSFSVDHRKKLWFSCGYITGALFADYSEERSHMIDNTSSSFSEASTLQAKLRAIREHAHARRGDKEPQASSSQQQGVQPRDDCVDLIVASPSIFLSSAAAAGNCDELQRLGITDVINVASSVPPPTNPCSNVTYHRYPLEDNASQDLLGALPPILALIDQLGSTSPPRRILVHCLWGVSRSVAVVAAWLISRRNCTLEQSMAMVRAGRPIANPNPAFCAMLFKLARTSATTSPTPAGT